MERDKEKDFIEFIASLRKAKREIEACQWFQVTWDYDNDEMATKLLDAWVNINRLLRKYDGAEERSR